MITVSITGVDAVERELASLPLKSQQAVADLAQMIYDRAQRGADAHTKTGALFQSTYLRQIGADGWEIGHDPKRAPHAVFVHWGTEPHEIRTKRKKSLRWANDGAFVFAKFARHPGYRGDPWLINAANDAIREFDTIVRRRFNA